MKSNPEQQINQSTPVITRHRGYGAGGLQSHQASKDEQSAQMTAAGKTGRQKQQQQLAIRGETAEEPGEASHRAGCVDHVHVHELARDGGLGVDDLSQEREVVRVRVQLQQLLVGLDDDRVATSQGVPRVPRPLGLLPHTAHTRGDNKGDAAQLGQSSLSTKERRTATTGRQSR
jgi:hypothetical protein